MIAHIYGGWQITTPATCTKVGEQKHTCTACGHEETSSIPKTSHEDINNNGICDTCNALTDLGKAKPISTVSDLRNISNDLSGTYYLTKDISLSGESWTPIGTSGAPFKGILHGNGHTISGLSSTTANVNGLFAYNSGLITALVIKDFTVGVGADYASTSGSLYEYTTTADRYAGLLVAINNGTIDNCTITGNNVLNSNSQCRVDCSGSLSSYHTLTYNAILGGFAGVNNSNITGCTLTGSLSSEVRAYSHYDHKVGLTYIQGTNDYAKNNSYVKFGGIAGRNIGTIKSCTNNASSSIVAKSLHDLNHANLHIGQCFTNLELKIGGTTGENTGNIIDTTSNKFNPTTEVTDPYSNNAHKIGKATLNIIKN